MLDPAQLGYFAVASLALLVIPGPAVLYIVARGIDQGRTAALVSVAGIHLGTVVHVVAAAVGLSAILAASATAFTVVKWAGAAYLIWLGIRRIREGDDPTPQVATGSLRRVFTQGVVVNVLNPKTAVFFLAFLPQFADPARGALAPQLVLLGLAFILIGLVTDGAYALASGGIGRALQRHRRAQQASRWVTGGTYIALGVGTAVAGSGSE